MAKYKYAFDESKLKRFIKEGRSPGFNRYPGMNISNLCQSCFCDGLRFIAGIQRV